MKRTATVVLVLSVLLSFVGPRPAGPLPAEAAPLACGSDASQVGCWQFSEGSGTTTADGSGNGNTGTLVGDDGTMWATDRFGNAGKALHFNGASQYVKVLDSASLDITGDITIAAWVKPEEVKTQDVVKKAVTDGTDGYELALSTTGTTCEVDGGVNPCGFGRFNQATYTNAYRIDAKTPYSATDPWTLYAVTYTAADTTLRIYRNGTLSNSRVVSALTIAPNSLFLGIGAQLAGSDPTASRFFHGSLDDVRIYKRALSAAEIRALAQDAAPAGLTCSSLQSRAGTANTEHKPMSKVWTYENKWWSVFPASSGVDPGAWLWRLDGTAWTPVLHLISTDTGVKADVKPAGTPVGSVVHILLYKDGASADLASVEYSGGSYVLWSARGSLTSVSLPGSETATVDIDSAGRMWLATQQDVSGSRDMIVYYSDSPYTAWNGPITLGTGTVQGDDISVVTALPNNTVGVLWANENSGRFVFRYHVDGADAGTWSAEELPTSQYGYPAPPKCFADDHMNVAVASDGTLYAAIKTSYDTAGYPKIALMVRRLTGGGGGGAWDTNIYGINESGTRPIVLLDENAGVVTVIYTSSEGEHDIVYNQTAIQPISFGAVQTMRSGTNNNASSTKQNINGEMVTIYSNSTTINGSHCTAIPGAGADLSITKTDNKTVALPGDASTYTIVATNNSATPVSGVTVADTFPAALTGVSWTCTASAGSSCAASGSGDINDTTVVLAAGGTATYTADATIAPSATGAVVNTATVAPPAGVTDPDTGNNSATDTTALRSGGALCGSDPNLVACYQLDEGAGTVYLDGVQNTVYNDGTTVNSPTWTGGVYGTALRFNGIDQYGYTPTETSLNIASQITLAAWVKPERVATQDLIKKVSGSAGYELTLSTNSGLSPYKAFVRFNGSDSYRVATTSNYCDNTSDCTVNTWKHLAATYDGTTIKIYFNGNLENSLAASFTISANTSPLSIGAFYNGSTATRYYQGAMDDVRVFNRALLDTEIETLADTPPTIVAFAPGDGTSGHYLNPTLAVQVTNADAEAMDISFYGQAPAARGEKLPRGAGIEAFQLVGTVPNVASGAEADMPWPGRSPYTAYQWYVTITTDDLIRTNTGPVWSFTTGEVTGITLGSFRAAAAGDGIRVTWETLSEVDTAGFNLWRSEAADGGYVKLNGALIAAQGGPTRPASYAYHDPGLAVGRTYYYKLEEVDTSGRGALHGPVWATAGRSVWVWLPLVSK